MSIASSIKTETMWLKLLLAFLIIAFSVALGYFAAEKFRERRAFYAQFDLFNARYLNELAYARTPLYEFIRPAEYKGDFSKLLSAFCRRERVEADFGYLSEEEKTECADYFSMLGKGDAASQSGYFGGKKMLLDEKKKKAEEEAASRGSLYLKLGLLAGLAFVILIV